MKYLNEMRLLVSDRVFKIVMSLPSVEVLDDVQMAVPMKDLIYYRAYYSSFISQIMRETAESFPLSNSHIESFFAFFLFWTFLTIVNRKNENVIDRLSDIIEYKTVRKNVSRILFVLYILFCKNVDSVS
jgi:hypothetical protein